MALNIISIFLLIWLLLRDLRVSRKVSGNETTDNLKLLPIILILSTILIIEQAYSGSSWYFGPLMRGQHFLVYAWLDFPLLIVMSIWPFYKLVLSNICSHGSREYFNTFFSGIRHKMFVAIKELFWGVLSISVYATLLISLEMLLSKTLLDSMAIDSFRNNLVRLSGSSLLYYLFLFDDIILFPFAEELFFRGLCYNAIKERLGVRKGLIISAIIFSFYHQDLARIIPYFLFGIFLARAYERSKTLLAPFITHLLYNIIFSYGLSLN